MEQLTHFKKLINPDYLGAYSLQPGEELVLTITKVSVKMVTGPDNQKDECTVAEFEELDKDGKQQKPMILNVTNCKTIAKVHGSPYIENWIGKKIQVYATTVKAFGEMHECLRIRNMVPASLLEEINELWGKLKDDTRLDDEQRTRISAVISEKQTQNYKRTLKFLKSL